MIPEAGLWQREGRTVYVLEHHGWKKGEEQFRNRWMCTVQGYCDEKEQEEISELIVRLPEVMAENRRLKQQRDAVLDSLKEYDSLLDKLMDCVDWGKTFRLPVAEMNAVPARGKQIIMALEGGAA